MQIFNFASHRSQPPRKIVQGVLWLASTSLGADTHEDYSSLDCVRDRIGKRGVGWGTAANGARAANDPADHRANASSASTAATRNEQASQTGQPRVQ
jgi:hypothetical protein